MNEIATEGFELGRGSGLVGTAGKGNGRVNMEFSFER